MKKNIPALFFSVAAFLFFTCIQSVSFAQDTASSTVTNKTTTSKSSIATDNVSPDKGAVTQDPVSASNGASKSSASSPTLTFLTAKKEGADASMVKMHGQYGMSMGFTTDEFMWKKANGDWQEKNWRYAFGDLDVNTYDTRVYDRYEVEIETDTKTPWNAYIDIVMDPWTFVSVGKETVYNTWNDGVNVRYKAWENTGYTINQTYRTNYGNVINIPEVKIKGNRVTPFTATPALWGEPNFNMSPDRAVEMDYLLRPVRKLWVEYRESPFYIKVFPIADQAQALTSDDPLRLSNNHVYWAPSPWLWRFDPGQSFGTDPVLGPRGQQEALWNWDEQWFAEDSNRHYLTFLRGISMGWNVEDFASLDITGAAPLGYWDYYETVTSVPIAARFKMTPSEKLTIGSTYTSKYGIYKQERRAQNHVIAADVTYNVWDKTDVFGEIAGSTLQITQINEENLKNTGSAYKVGIRSKVDFSEGNSIKWDSSFSCMSKNFSPGLADYRDTREDRDWGRHIWFEPISSDDEYSRIGDGIDINRSTVGANARIQLLDNMFDIFLNMRNANDEYTGKFVENTARAEITYNPMKHVQMKGLILNRKYHDTIGGRDATIRDRYTDELWQNNSVMDGQSVDIMTFSGGAKVDLSKMVSVYGIYEATNDPQDFPRNILNTPQTGPLITVDNIRFNRLDYLLYNQNLFSLPSYEFYNMVKGCVTVTPVKDVQIKYTHVTNTNRNYAALFDNNHSHDEITVTFSPAKRVTWTTGYSVSRVIDLQRAMDTNGSDRQYGSHSNIYSQINWDFKKDQRLTFQFGEANLLEPSGSVFGPSWVSQNTSVLDTQPIFRVWYQGKF